MLSSIGRYITHFNKIQIIFLGKAMSNAKLSNEAADDQKDTSAKESPGSNASKKRRESDHLGGSQPETTINKKLTRTNIVLKEKERILSLKLEEKRKLYRCGPQFVTPTDLQSWPNLYMENVYFNKQKDADPEKEYSVRKDLNEKIFIFRRDITTLEIDAIVNAANKSLLGGGGVDGAIHRAAGSSLLAECKTLAGCETGQAKLTGGYNLPAKYVIHTVGPVGEDAEMLKKCYKNCLENCRVNKLQSVAFPCISTGIYGYPNDAAADVSLRTIREWLEANPEKIEMIVLCLFMPADADVYSKLLREYFPIEERSSKNEGQQSAKNRRKNIGKSDNENESARNSVDKEGEIFVNKLNKGSGTGKEVSKKEKIETGGKKKNEEGKGTSREKKNEEGKVTSGIKTNEEGKGTSGIKKNEVGKGDRRDNKNEEGKGTSGIKLNEEGKGTSGIKNSEEGKGTGGEKKNRAKNYKGDRERTGDGKENGTREDEKHKKTVQQAQP